MLYLVSRILDSVKLVHRVSIVQFWGNLQLIQLMFVMQDSFVTDALSDLSQLTLLLAQSVPQEDIALKVVLLKASVFLAGLVSSRGPTTIQLALSVKQDTTVKVLVEVRAPRRYVQLALSAQKVPSIT